MTTYTYFIESFGGKKLITQSNIQVFTKGKNHEKHIDICEKEQRILGYKDERVWRQLFHKTLDDIPNKWYKMKEARA